MRPRESEGKYKDLPTQRRGLWAQPWPLKDVCGMHPDAVAPPTRAQAHPSPGHDLSLNHTTPRTTSNRLKTVNSRCKRESSEWHEVWMVIERCQLKTSEEFLPCKILAYSMRLKTQTPNTEIKIANNLAAEKKVKDKSLSWTPCSQPYCKLQYNILNISAWKRQRF